MVRKLIATFGVMCSVLALGLSAPDMARCSGFAIIEQGVDGLGNAFAGGAAVADNATTIYFNPAGMTRIEGQEAIFALHYIDPKVEFTNDQSTGPLGAPANGGDGGEASDGAFVPNAYYVYSTGDWAVGLGLYAPFGLSTDYNKRWVGRYLATESDLATLNINPTFAYRVNKNFSLGGGVSFQYLDATLANAQNYGLLTFIGSGANPALAGRVSDPDFDVQAELTADGWAYGFQLGVLYEVDEHTRFGLAYHSGFTYDLSGDAEFTPAAADPTGSAAAFPNTGADATIDLPGTVSLSGYHDINEQWAVMADVTWTNWSVFDELKVEFDTPVAGGTVSESITEYDYDDTWRYSVGATYKPSAPWTVRGGLAFDQSPVPNDEKRSPRVPDNDRTWLAIGGGYEPVQNLKFDLAYVHIWVKDTDIENDSSASQGLVDGSYDNAVDIVSAQVAYRW